MKLMIAIAFSLCLLQGIAQAQEPTGPPANGVILEPAKFDEWADVRYSEEKTHLNKIAAQAKEWSLSIVYLVIHAGQTACVGEARARGVRAKNYLMHSGLSSERIVWIDAGWRKNVTIEVWIWPPQLGKPRPSTDLDLKPREVRLLKNCKTKTPEP